MAAKTMEILFSDMPSKIILRLNRYFVPDERILESCYNADRKQYYIITARRIVNIFDEQISPRLALEIRSVLLTDIILIEDNSYRNNLFIYHIRTMNKDATFEFQFNEANDLAFKFGSTLFQVYNQAKAIR